jgi:general secretion pathway protein D
MRLIKYFIKVPVFLTAIALISLFWWPESSRAAKVTGSDEPVTTIQQSPQTTSGEPAVTAPDPARKVIRVTPSKVVSSELEAPAPDNITPPPQDNSLREPEIPVEKEAQAASNSADLTQEEPATPQPKRLISSQPVKKRAEKYVTIDFDNVDIGVFVKFVSELTGKNFVIDDKVKGKVTIISPKKIPVGDVYRVFLSVLEVYGFTTVSVGDMIKVIPAISAREKFMETRLKKEQGAPEDRIITQIITLERANPDEIKRVLDPIVSKNSSVLSYPPAGMLVITDFQSNIKRLQEIVTALDVEGAGEQISYVPLQNASAGEVVKSLSTIFQQRRPTLTPIRFVPDSRTNSIILLASVADTDNVRKLIDLMDKDIPRGESNVQVYRLQNSNSEDLVKVLTNITKDTKAAADPQKASQAVVAKNVQIVSDKATNTLVIMAEREDYKIIEGIIKKLDVPRPMVYIEALIMEVNTTKAFTLGVEWRGLKNTGAISGVDTGQSAAFVGSGGAGSTANPGGYNILGGLTNTAFPGGYSLGIIGAGISIGGILFPNIGAVIQAYKQDEDVSILSTPQIMTIDNEEAEINVGSNVPYITSQQSSTTATASVTTPGLSPVNYNTFEYRDVGVILNITPHINEENFIRLKISQQVTKVTSGTSTTPTTLKRTAKTTVVIRDNETVVIGGLVGDSTDELTYKLPFFGDIPLLGWLFKTKSNTREKTNLYVFLTPHIIRTQKDAQKIFDEKKETMGEVVEGIIKLNEKKPETKQPNKGTPAGKTNPDKS